MTMMMPFIFSGKKDVKKSSIVVQRTVEEVLDVAVVARTGRHTNAIMLSLSPRCPTDDSFVCC